MEYKGLAIENEAVSIEGDNLVGSVDLVHEGKIGGITINIKGNFKFIPLVNAGLDKIEAIIPGDQKFIFDILKDQVAKIKIKF